MSEKNLKESNPNAIAKELIEPMIFEKEDGTPLIEPLVFYDRPLDLDYPLPDIPPLGMEYFVNWKNVQKTSDVPVFVDDYLKAVNISDTGKTEDTAHNFNKLTINEYKKTIEESQDSKNEETITAYRIMTNLLEIKKIIIINETFYVYSGTSYEAQNHKGIARLVMQYCRDLIKNKPNSAAFVDSVVNLITIEPKIVISQYNLPKTFISFRNGVLDIKRNQFYAHSPDYLTLYEIYANYYPNANIQTPIFDDYISTISGNDPLLIERILQSIGYILTPDNNGKCFFLLQGVYNSGKSVLTNLIQRLFNSNAVVQLEAQSFGDKFTASELIGKALCVFPDIPKSPLNDAAVSRLKLYTGNDPISASIKYKSNEKFVCAAKFLISTNHALLTLNEDNAFRHRIVTVPFRYGIPKENENHELEDQLFAERDGIVSKAMAAYFRLVSNKYVYAGEFKPNEVVAEILDDDIDYRLHLYEFVKNNFERKDGGVVYIDSAYNLFRKNVSGISMNDFSHYFKQYSCEMFDAHKDRKRRKNAINALSCMLGISFKSEVEDDLS